MNPAAPVTRIRSSGLARNLGRNDATAVSVRLNLPPQNSPLCRQIHSTVCRHGRRTGNLQRKSSFELGELSIVSQEGTCHPQLQPSYALRSIRLNPLRRMLSGASETMTLPLLPLQTKRLDSSSPESSRDSNLPRVSQERG